MEGIRRIELMLTPAALLLAGLLWGSAGLADEGGTEQKAPSVQEIVEKANQVAFYQGGTGRSVVKMTMYDTKGKVRGRREIVMLRRNAEKGLDQKLFAYFQVPADVRGTVFLVWKHSDKDDDRWLYNPGLDLVNRISAADKRTSFVGADFFYEDVSGRNIQDDKHELIKTTKNYFVLRNIPKNPDGVEFSYFDMYIHRQTFMPLYAYFYDKSGEKCREYRVLNMQKIQGYWTATKSEMIDYTQQGEKPALTVAEFSDIEYEIKLPDSVFTERYLRKPPLQYLKIK